MYTRLISTASAVHTGLYINTGLCFILVSKSITPANTISGMTYCSLSVYFHIFAFTFLIFIHLLLYLPDISQRLGVWILGLLGFWFSISFPKRTRGYTECAVMGRSFDPYPLILHRSVFVINPLFGLSALYCAKN